MRPSIRGRRWLGMCCIWRRHAGFIASRPCAESCNPCTSVPKLLLSAKRVGDAVHAIVPRRSTGSVRMKKGLAAASRGFTLVELLVVIGIIALLVSILLPVLGKVREQASAVKCASNLRQIAAGWLMYADAYKGAACPGRMAKMSNSTNVYWVGNGEQFRPRWFVTLGAQTKIHAYQQPSADPADDNTKLVDNPVFMCPTEPERVNNRNFTYGYNFQFLWNSRMKSGGGFINFPVKVSRVKASQTVMAADAMG